MIDGAVTWCIARHVHWGVYFTWRPGGCIACGVHIVLACEMPALHRSRHGKASAARKGRGCGAAAPPSLLPPSRPLLDDDPEDLAVVADMRDLVVEAARRRRGRAVGVVLGATAEPRADVVRALDRRLPGEGCAGSARHGFCPQGPEELVLSLAEDSDALDELQGDVLALEVRGDRRHDRVGVQAQQAGCPRLEGHAGYERLEELGHAVFFGVDDRVELAVHPDHALERQVRAGVREVRY